MFSLVVLCLVLATGTAAFQIREAVVLGDRRALWRRSARAAPLLILTCSAMWLLIRDPGLASTWPPSGFGPSWECANYGKGGTTVCFKGDPPKDQRNTTPSQN
jgi:hypothetical protein